MTMMQMNVQGGWPQKTAKSLLGVVIAATVTACASHGGQREQAYTARELNEQLVMSTLWMQSAAEYQALSYQAFNMAKLRLDQAMKDRKQGDKPLAVVVDCDETVIDNSAFEAYLVGHDAEYSSALWGQWVNDAQAKALPGATSFLNYAQRHGVEVFYITNRKQAELAPTMQNLAQLGFPYVDTRHVMMRTDTSDKQPRRDQVLQDHNVVLYMGDNLADFDSGYDAPEATTRQQHVKEQQALFGERFIMLPNPAYGGWEGALYEGDYSLSPGEKDQRRKAALMPWQPANL
ncbi:5'-nucleotidase, lipoprotein e(P4) family [Phytohalomonas tamaricis]|uniref:5'-nucleotidase, lipoprotein e(P4) family n=1 Tax=Phytohalomonas tamaricis TaxID=2081032 RepID=UPI0021D43D50|nr:5'-nucleotidase, lipoprotein e(P4) family [Phytohalomonas tamaricis]